MRVLLEHYLRVMGIETDPVVKMEIQALDRIAQRNWEG